MDVEIISLTEEAVEERDYRDIIEIKFDGVRVFIVSDGEPGDSNLNRNFNNCWKVPGLIRTAYNTGLAGKELTVKYTEIDNK